ncbi:MAG TPA: isoprenylcysteine carboxylmethyltransferase family protein [Vicinamibacterales bacterium]|jgi:methyltransferase|nr:isoprenylcysteine carboxylmethyltransferase family protein [Vicinamibacterales bacterium]
MNTLLLATMVLVPMLGEWWVSMRNERQLRAQGAVEPDGDVYTLMQIIYPASFLAIIFESAQRAPDRDALVAAGFAVFVAAKMLKYWAITTLGVRWTFRVLVPPASSVISAGPYRLLSHPNYVAVIGELVGAALIAHAVVTGPIAVALFGTLILLRIRTEERALGRR